MLGMLLAEQGADVIKVERPGGDPARTEPAFATWNRSKRSVELDLKTPDGLASARELIDWADVAIENFRPGVADRLGIGYGSTGSKPRSSTAPSPASVKTAPTVTTAAGRPFAALPPAPIRASPAWTSLLFPALACRQQLRRHHRLGLRRHGLIARQRTGRGQRIEVPLHSAMFAAMGRHLSNFHDINPPDLFTLPRTLMSHQYQCADGRYVQNHGMYQRFAQPVPPGSWPPRVDRRPRGTLTALTSARDHRALEGARPESVQGKDPQEWEDAIAETGGACTVCKTVDEWSSTITPSLARNGRRGRRCRGTAG